MVIKIESERKNRNKLNFEFKDNPGPIVFKVQISY